MASKNIPRPGTPKPEMGGVAMYNYALVDALLSARYAAMQTDDTRMFHSAVNWFLMLSSPTTDYYGQSWQEWLKQEGMGKRRSQTDGTLVLSKHDRMREIARALKLLQDQGILWFKKGRYTGDAEQLEKYFDKANPDEGEDAESDES